MDNKAFDTDEDNNKKLEVSLVSFNDLRFILNEVQIEESPGKKPQPGPSVMMRNKDCVVQGSAKWSSWQILAGRFLMRNEKFHIYKNVLLISVAFLALFIGFESMSKLQSSINSVSFTSQMGFKLKR